MSVLTHGHKCPCYTTSPDESGFRAPFMGHDWFCSTAIHRLENFPSARE
jgi:hypothetical protein